jgi:hypothetical protein
MYIKVSFINFLLHLFQIIGHFDFSRFVNIIIYKGGSSGGACFKL